MRIILLSAVKDWTGLIDVTVRVNNKKDYTFTVASQFDVDEFERILKYNPGKALNWLKKTNKRRSL